jgi:hypothetical protein
VIRWNEFRDREQVCGGEDDVENDRGHADPDRDQSNAPTLGNVELHPSE